MFVNLKRLVKSFRYALHGLKVVVKEEQNFRVHLLAAFLVALFSVVLGVSEMEFVALVIVIALVLIAELVNSIFERIADILKPRLHPDAAVIKDVMAATVIVAVICAIMVGGVIFIPKLLILFK